VKWIVAPTSTEYREGLNSFIAAMDISKTGKIISDATIWERSIRMISSGRLQSGSKELSKWDIANGFIIPNDVLYTMSVEDTMNQVAGRFPFCLFRQHGNCN